jgi:hypothetical protein
VALVAEVGQRLAQIWLRSGVPSYFLFSDAFRISCLEPLVPTQKTIFANLIASSRSAADELAMEIAEADSEQQRVMEPSPTTKFRQDEPLFFHLIFSP